MSYRNKKLKRQVLTRLGTGWMSDDELDTARKAVQDFMDDEWAYLTIPTGAGAFIAMNVSPKSQKRIRMPRKRRNLNEPFTLNGVRVKLAKCKHQTDEAADRAQDDIDEGIYR